jgi:hypothetical protein
MPGPTAAKGRMPFEGHRTVAEVDAWTDAKAKRELKGLWAIERRTLRQSLAVGHIMAGRAW